MLPPLTGPAGAFLSSGTDLQNGSWLLLAEDLASLTVTMPEGSADSFSLSIRVTATETASGDTATAVRTITGGISDSEPVILDNGNPGTWATGVWHPYSESDSYGADSLKNADAGAYYEYQTQLTGCVELALWWAYYYQAMCDAVRVEIHDGPWLLDIVTVNQMENTGQWNVIGEYNFTVGAGVLVRSAGGCRTSADAARFTPAPECPPSASRMQSPVPGSTFGSTVQTFVWNDCGAQQYWLYVGSTGPGSYDVYSGNQGTNTSKLVGGLPNNGETLYVRLFSLIGGFWCRNDYTYAAYTGASGPTAAVMQSPVPGLTFGSTDETFVWTDCGAELYWLYVGTTRTGSYDVYNGKQGTNTSRTVSGLPGNEETVYVRLFSLIGGTWYRNDYTYTATGP